MYGDQFEKRIFFQIHNQSMWILGLKGLNSVRGS